MSTTLIDTLRYHRDLAECVCDLDLPTGGCARCDFDHLLVLAGERESLSGEDAPLPPVPTDTEMLDWFEEHNRDFRYCATVTMDGKYPCWSVWTRKEGSTTRKTLREAIRASMDLEH